MSTMLFLLLSVTALLLVLLIWLVRAPQKNGILPPIDAAIDDSGRRHPTYFPMIRQAMSPADLGFLAERGSVTLVRRAHKERQRIALLYLADLRGDLERLLHLARVIAVLSPEVRATQELERLRLTVQFFRRYHLILWALRFGLLLLPQLSGLSAMVSALSVRMESAMTALGERAALAADLASSLNRRGLDMV